MASRETRNVNVPVFSLRRALRQRDKTCPKISLTSQETPHQELGRVLSKAWRRSGPSDGFVAFYSPERFSIAAIDELVYLLRLRSRP